MRKEKPISPLSKAKKEAQWEEKFSECQFILLSLSLTRSLFLRFAFLSLRLRLTSKRSVRAAKREFRKDWKASKMREEERNGKCRHMKERPLKSVCLLNWRYPMRMKGIKLLYSMEKLLIANKLNYFWCFLIFQKKTVHSTAEHTASEQQVEEDEEKAKHQQTWKIITSGYKSSWYNHKRERELFFLLTVQREGGEEKGIKAHDRRARKKKRSANLLSSTIPQK